MVRYATNTRVDDMSDDDDNDGDDSDMHESDGMEEAAVSAAALRWRFGKVGAHALCSHLHLLLCPCSPVSST